MKRSLLFFFVSCMLCAVVFHFSACKEENVETTYKGTVVNSVDNQPFPNLEVKITDGNHINTTVHTNEAGFFSILVRFNEINSSYYLLIGDSSCAPVKRDFKGFGQPVIDLGVIEVEGPKPPIVITDSVTDINAESALCGGNVTDDGRAKVTRRGVVYSKEEYPSLEKDKYTTNGEGKGAFQSQLTDLEYGTTYYVRAYATNRIGTTYGEQVSFTTTKGVALVITDSVYKVTAHTAKCKAHVESDGGFAITKRGTCWSTKPDPTIDDNITEDGSGLGAYSSTLKELVENTTYYVRAYATNSTSTVYGEQIIITTLDGLAVVQTDSVNTLKAASFTCYGNVLSDCDIPVTARGFVYATTEYPTKNDNEYTTSEKGLGVFKSTISKLEYGTTYYIRAYATNATATVYGKQISVTTLDGLPTVTTTQVTNIGSVKATCGGKVTDDGTLTVLARGVCYGTEQQPTIEGLHTIDGKGKGEFTSNLKELKDKTTYYVRAYATTDAGTAYGEQRTFKTADGTPTVELTVVGSPTPNSVICSGNVTGDGGVTVIERGFCYSSSQYPTNQDGHVAIGDGLGEFTGTLNGLTVNTQYYVRAYVVNTIGVGYSEQQTFTTLDGMPVVTTAEPTAAATSINAGGEVTANGGYAVSERGVCYSTTNSEPTTNDDKAVSGKGNGTFKVAITGLTASTTYYLRAYAVNENGTAYGETHAIITTDGLATLTIGEIENITALSASGTVTVSDAGGATIQSCGICWATTPNPTIENNKAIGGNQLNTTYTCNLTELAPNTTYYVRGYVTTDATTTYSEQVICQTKNGAAIMSVGEIENITALTASGMVTVTDAGGATLQSCGICWATTPNPTIENNKVSGGNQINTAYTCNMMELSPNTTYYVRAWATTDITTAYSEQVTFKTATGLPELKTGTSTTTASSFTISSEVTGNGGYAVSERGICYSKTNAEPSITDTKVASGSGNGTFKSSVSGLTASTSYYVRAYATNSIGTAYGEVITVATKDGAATISIGEIENIMALSASGSVTATNAGGSTLKECGICWATTQNPTIENNKASGGNQLNTAYTCNMSELSPNTTYYVRAYATTNVKTTYSEQKSFKTTTGLPEISTGTATTTATSFTISSEVTGNGGYTVSERGICYSKTNAEPSITDTKVASGSGNGTFSTSAHDLLVSTTYYVRAYATNSIGTAYGEVITVTTNNGVAIVSIGEITNITDLSASESVTVTNAGGATLNECGLCWSTTQNPTIENNKTIGGNQLNTTYTCNITKLSPNTTYYVRGYATTDITTSYSEQKAFTTITGLPELKTGTATTTATSFTISSEVTSNGGYTIFERGICYSKTNAEPSITDTKVASGSGNGTFSTSAHDLLVSTTYYVRAYATNSIGTAYGEAITIKTKSGMATVIMGGINNITTTTASGTVTITEVDGATIESCGICWATNPNPTIENNVAFAGGTQLNTAYSCSMSSLSSGTTYNICAFATTEITTVYSAVNTFTTLIEVSGIVKNESNQAIPNATIKFKSENTTIKSITTDANGNFSLQIAQGSYNVEITATGYTNLSQIIYVDTTPLEFTMKQLGILCGTVYDDDNIPLANATISVKSSVNNITYDAISNSDGSYKIENLPLGQTSSITCSLTGYKLTYSIPNQEINSGNNNLNITMSILTPSTCSPSGFIFECYNEGMPGTTVIKTFNLQNNRQKAVSWSLSGIPSKGVTFNPSSGTLSAKSSVTITATITYPGYNVSGSVRTALYNCYINNKKWPYTYLWNWTYSGMLNDCATWCAQDITVLIGNNSHNINITVYQWVVWDE